MTRTPDEIEQGFLKIFTVKFHGFVYDFLSTVLKLYNLNCSDFELRSYIMYLFTYTFVCIVTSMPQNDKDLW